VWSDRQWATNGVSQQQGAGRSQEPADQTVFLVEMVLFTAPVAGTVDQPMGFQRFNNPDD